jgi:8-oxo-dGTP diphosphatase
MPNAVIRVVAAVIAREGKYLITQRRDGAVLPNLWEFPGGKVEVGESDEAALRREVRERLGVDVRVDTKAAEKHHKYDGYEVHLTLYDCHLDLGVHPEPIRVKDLRWVTSAEFGEYRFPPADQATMDKLLGLETWQPKT